MTKEELMKRNVEAKREGFTNWMNEPMTRAMISMMPPFEHLEMLLRAAFETGFNSGFVNAVLDIMGKCDEEGR